MSKKETKKVKKHIDHMTTEELKEIRRVLNDRNYGIGEHCYESMSKRGIKRHIIKSTIEMGRIVEFQLVDDVPRIVLRMIPARLDLSACIVVELHKTTNQVVTTFKKKMSKTKKGHFTPYLDIVGTIKHL